MEEEDVEVAVGVLVLASHSWAPPELTSTVPMPSVVLTPDGLDSKDMRDGTPKTTDMSPLLRPITCAVQYEPFGP